MTAGPQRAGQRPAGTLAPVPPSRLVRIVMRPLTRVLNPLVGLLAGRPHFRMAAQIRHVGRRSGRLYVTPAGARRSGQMIVIPLTFGNQSDWARNVRTAGGCSVRLGGRDYQATQPEFVPASDAGPLVRSAFGPLERASFKMLGIRQFMTLRIMSAEP